MAANSWSLPWLERNGRFSPFKCAVFIGTLLPGFWIAGNWALDMLGPKPVTEAIHETGEWTIRLLLISLAITPLRRVLQWPRLIVVRRMVGVSALAYVLAHLTLYALDNHFDLAFVASEIVLRIYLTIGFVALLGLAVLGATSTDSALRKLGKRWQPLHRIVYGIAVLGILHFFMQSKIDVTEATLMAGLFWLLMGWRLMARWANPPGFFLLVGLAVAGAALTVLTEAAWYYFATGVPVERVLLANLSFSYSIRPVWWVLGTGLLVALVQLGRSQFARLRAARPARA